MEFQNQGTCSDLLHHFIASFSMEVTFTGGTTFLPKDMLGKELDVRPFKKP